MLRDAGGLPAAVEQMLAGALAEREVSRRTVRDLSSDAATTYLDMTWLLVILVAVAMAVRYIGRGIGAQELSLVADGWAAVYHRQYCKDSDVTRREGRRGRRGGGSGRRRARIKAPGTTAIATRRPAEPSAGRRLGPAGPYSWLALREVV